MCMLTPSKQQSRAIAIGAIGAVGISLLGNQH